MEEFKCDIVHVLQNRDFSILQKLMSHSYNFRASIAAQKDNATAYEIECLEKRTLTNNRITELHQEIETLKSELDATTLQQKVVDKYISDALTLQDKLKKEIDTIKSKTEHVSLEIIELQQEYEKRKQTKVATWDAIKRACHIYKQYLDIRIQLIDNTDYTHIKMSFFINNDAIKDNYFVELLHHNTHWTVEEIQPALKTEHLNDLKGIADFRQSVVLDITAFLCKLRHIFVKYYLNLL